MADGKSDDRSNERHQRSYDAPDLAFERRLTSRRTRSADSRGPARPRRLSLHRDYHSDNESIQVATNTGIEEIRVHSYGKSHSISDKDASFVPERSGTSSPVGPRSHYHPLSRGGTADRPSLSECPPSLEESEESEDYKQLIPVKRTGMRHSRRSQVPSPPRFTRAREPVLAEPSSPFAGTSIISYYKQKRSRPPFRLPSREQNSTKVGPRRRRSSHDPPSRTCVDDLPRIGRVQLASPSHPSPNRDSFKEVVFLPREPTPEPRGLSYARQDHKEPPGMKSRRRDRIEALDEPHFIPGEFTSEINNIRRNGSRSQTSQSDREKGHWTRRIQTGDYPSATRPTHRPSTSSSSGILGDKAYQYSPLGPTEFRLVRLLPARMSTIKCEIFHESLYHPPPYTAVSYAWGDPDDTRKILLDGVKIPVAVSLYGALEALRRKDGSVTIWIDYLCIDQQNRHERTQQVQLMDRIYSNAEIVAIWLGSEADNSDNAIKLLKVVEDIAANADSDERMRDFISTQVGAPGMAAIVSLFERDYWRRLWVVQEVYNARELMVYCGTLKLQWKALRSACYAFWRHKSDIDHYFPSTFSSGFSQSFSSNKFSYSQVLVYQGPSSFPDVGSLSALGNDSLLEIMRACRDKLSADPRDKVYGVLGMLPEDIRSEFTVDYSVSIKEVYIDVVDYLLHSTDRLDAIREAIHFPLHSSSSSLPSWVPDWSHSPEITGLDVRSWASGVTKADYKFLDNRRKLEISAIYVDKIAVRGIAVGTFCTLPDYLMAFLHWRALVLESSGSDDDEHDSRLQEIFCKTLCLNQIPEEFEESNAWTTHCLHVFASLIHERLPRLQLDRGLLRYTYMDADMRLKPEDRRSFLQQHFANKMMGRCLCITDQGLIGMGSGFMALGDLVVVPLGCSTPIILRRDRPRGGYRYVGDVYIHGYMTGKALQQWKSGEKELRRFVLH